MYQSKRRCTEPREPLQAVDPNRSSARRVRSRRTTQRCMQRGVPLCSDCFKDHMQAVNRTEETDSEDPEKHSKSTFWQIIVGRSGRENNQLGETQGSGQNLYGARDLFKRGIFIIQSNFGCTDHRALLIEQGISRHVPAVSECEAWCIGVLREQTIYVRDNRQPVGNTR